MPPQKFGMKKKQLDILPGVGLGEVKFGMSREEAASLLGEPQAKEVVSYSDEEDEKSDSWEYQDLRIDLSFEEAEDWRLVIISVSSEEYLLNGKTLIGSDQEELMTELAQLEISDLMVEDLSDEQNLNQQLISSELLGINFWLVEDTVQEIQWAPLFIDDDTIDWPN